MSTCERHQGYSGELGRAGIGRQTGRCTHSLAIPQASVNPDVPASRQGGLRDNLDQEASLPSGQGPCCVGIVGDVAVRPRKRGVSQRGGGGGDEMFAPSSFGEAPARVDSGEGLRDNEQAQVERVGKMVRGRGYKQQRHTPPTRAAVVCTRQGPR